MASFLGYWLLTPFTLCLKGVALSLLWGWFIVPLGIPRIGIIWAIGLAATVRGFVETAPDFAKIEQQSKERYGSPEEGGFNVRRMVYDMRLAIIGAIMGPVITIAFGWLLHIIMIAT